MFVGQTDVEICAKRFGHFLPEKSPDTLSADPSDDFAHQKPERHGMIARLRARLP
jgi:hypothetical protein